MSPVHHACELERHIVAQLASSGWQVGRSDAYDRARALYPEDVTGWLRDSQPAAWDKLRRLNGDDTEAVLLDLLVTALEAPEGGTLDLLRRGFAVAGNGQLAMSQALPEDDRSHGVIARYAANRLRVVPQLLYAADSADPIDLVLFINGLPVATVELATDDTPGVQAAMARYRDIRPPRDAGTGRDEPLLAFRRGAVVHFAMSGSDIRMSTRLDGGSTVFQPFDRDDDGAANHAPDDDGGGPLAERWQRMLARDAWLGLFHRFVMLEREVVQGAQGRTQCAGTMVFPRWHQWACVTALVDAVRAEGAGQPYLVQHGAGPGTRHTLAWLSHALIRIRRDDGEPCFHCVIVVTDRTALDQQLQDAIAQIEHQSGVVRAIDKEPSLLPRSQQLAMAMLAGTPIIVCTLQTFVQAHKLILGEHDLRHRRFAVVIDEAHGSTGGGKADDLRHLLTGQSEQAWQRLGADPRQSMWQASRSRPGRASYFAFAATPGRSLLGLFGRPRDAGAPVSGANPPVPFHTAG